MAKIYTRTGDDGSTGLIGPGRVPKCDARVECYGTVDELNAALGLAAVAAGANEQLAARIRTVQNDLFTVGCHLATSDESYEAALPPLDQDMIVRLEREIDSADAQLPPLHAFILPGGTDAAARLHVARTTCRRAERLTVAVAQERHVQPAVIVYLNRLGDWLFVHARLANFLAGVADTPWMKP
jgi:cob(I)alamin adenosyltransferase